MSTIDDKDLPEDLLGDIVPEINPEKLFDENEYSTLVLGSDNTLKKDTDSIQAIEVLINKTSTREEKDEALIQLKENKAQGVLVNAIEQVKKGRAQSTISSCLLGNRLRFWQLFFKFHRLNHSH